MRYHYEKPLLYSTNYGTTHTCNHSIYNRCTLFLIGKKGLAVIQQRYDNTSKTTWWSEIDEWLNDEIYLHPNFKTYFDSSADIPVNGIYPTVTLRQIMWALKIRPLKKQVWETYFDRKKI